MTHHNGRYIVGCIARLSFAIAVISLGKAAFNYAHDSSTIATECEVIRHEVESGFCLYNFNSYMAVSTVCHVVHEWTDSYNESLSWCRGYVISGCYYTREAAWEALAKRPIGSVYPCYYQTDWVKYAFNDRFEWQLWMRVGAFAFYISVLSFILIFTSKATVKVKVQ